MTAVLGVVALGLALALALLLASQRSLARRLLHAGARLVPDVVPTGGGLAEATSVVERVVDRALARGGDVSLAEARLASALAAMPQGVVVFDSDGGIAFRNKVAARYLAARHGEALVEEAIKDLAESLLAGDSSAAPQRTVDLFGPPRRTLALHGIALERNDDDLGALVMIEDLTDRRRLEAVRRDFVANVSHELKTPVGALGLLAETLLAEDDPAVARRLAERMLHESFRVARTIDDLLELSRIEADDRASSEEVLVGSFVREAVERVAGAAERRRIAVEVDDAAAAHLAVKGDRRQLVSAVYNLLDNAVKYSHEGSSVKVEVRLDGQWVDVEVRDRGVGIPRRDLERVFERFYRVDRGRSSETGGTGLGLAIVRHVATNHSGEVRVESHEGEGSTLTLRLPARPVGADVGAAAGGDD
ncbi:MAG: sensor histidine kinase [Actinomycetota bacterium]